MLCLAAVSLGGDAHDDVIELVTSMAAALTASDVPRFMSAFDQNMPDYGRLETAVTGLVNQADVSSAIEPLSDEGNNQKRSMDLDWLLEVRSLEQAGPVVRRREVVHCEIEKQKKHWKIVSLKPLDFFTPANLAP